MAGKMLEGATQRPQTVTADGGRVDPLIDGVAVRDVRNVVSANSVVTEVFRRDWNMGSNEVAQVTMFTFHPRAIAAWDCHESQQDRVICLEGLVRLVLYDAREGSPTRGNVNIFHLSETRPTLVLIPEMIWHGFQNLLHEPSRTLVCVDRMFQHDRPDSWKLAFDSDEIPYKFKP